MSITSNVTSRYRRWRQYRATVRQLSNLSAAELEDIGITPGTIPSVARDAVNRRYGN